MDSLVTLMNKTDKVRLTGPGTDLTFSIKDIPAIKCSGHLNIPDGEVYSAPVRDSVNGTVSYNTPSPYNGYTFENVQLKFENGQIVEATANDTERINKIFDTDEGARYVGEFAIGVNPYILHPMGDILFDEKSMAASTSLLDKLTTMHGTAITRTFTGIYASNVLNTAVAKFTSTTY